MRIDGFSPFSLLRWYFFFHEKYTLCMRSIFVKSDFQRFHVSSCKDTLRTLFSHSAVKNLRLRRTKFLIINHKKKMWKRINCRLSGSICRACFFFSGTLFVYFFLVLCRVSFLFPPFLLHFDLLPFSLCHAVHRSVLCDDDPPWCHSERDTQNYCTSHTALPGVSISSVSWVREYT